MKTLQSIWTFLKNPTYQRIAMLVGIFVLAFFLFKNCGRTNTDNEITQLKQNLSYYQDSLKIEKNKAKETEYTRSVLAAKNKTLEDLNADLSAEVKKEKGTVINLNKIVIELTNRIIELTNDSNIVIKVWPDGSQSIEWRYDTVYSPGNERHLSSSSRFNFLKDTTLIDKKSVSVKILEDRLKMTLVTGLQEDKDTKLLKIFVRSDYPGFSVSKIDGAIIDPQKSELIKSYFPKEKFGLGFNLGYGAALCTDGKIRTGLILSVGISYNLITFNPKKLFKK
jgi:hypothetical protein